MQRVSRTTLSKSIASAIRNEVREMKITIKATPEEIAKLLQAIRSSEEQQILYNPTTGYGTVIPQKK